MTFKFVLNRSGVRELLRGSEIQNILDSYASDVLERAGDGYKKNSMVGKNRANSMVYADSIRAKRDNLKNNTLLKVLR